MWLALKLLTVFILLLVGEVASQTQAEVLCTLINEYRVQNSLQPVPWSVALFAVADSHVQDSALNNPAGPAECNLHSWSNNPPLWTGCCYTADHAQSSCMWQKPAQITNGWGANKYTAYGYEISYGSGGGTATPQGALNGWKGSPGHNNVILNQDIWASRNPWPAMGCGIYAGYAHVWFGDMTDPQPYGSPPATTGQATTGQATTGQATTGQATTGPATTGQGTAGQGTTGQGTTGQGTIGQATTGQPSPPPTGTRDDDPPILPPGQPANVEDEGKVMGMSAAAAGALWSAIALLVIAGIVAAILFMVVRRRRSQGRSPQANISLNTAEGGGSTAQAPSYSQPPPPMRSPAAPPSFGSTPSYARPTPPPSNNGFQQPRPPVTGYSSPNGFGQARPTPPPNNGFQQSRPTAPGYSNSPNGFQQSRPTPGFAPSPPARSQRPAPPPPRW